MTQLAPAPLYHFPKYADLRVTKTGRVIVNVSKNGDFCEAQCHLTDVRELGLNKEGVISLTLHDDAMEIKTPNFATAKPIYDVLHATWLYYLGLYDTDELPVVDVP